MPSVKLFKQDGTSAGEVSLKDELFGIEPNNNIVFDVEFKCWYNTLCCICVTHIYNRS